MAKDPFLNLNSPDLASARKAKAQLVANLPVLDIETSGLRATGDSIIQVGFISSKGRAREFNLLPSTFENKIGIVPREILGTLKEYGLSERQTAEIVKSALYQQRGFLKGIDKYRSITVDQGKFNRLLSNSLSKLLAAQKNPILIHNAKFESRFLRNHGITLDFSKEYHEIGNLIPSGMKRPEEGFFNEFLSSTRGISPTSPVFEAHRLNYATSLFEHNLTHQVARYDYFLGHAKKGHVIDTQEMAKAAYGLMQDIGMAPKTFDFFTGTSVSFLSKHLLDKSELHTGLADASLEQELPPYLVELVEKLKTVKESKVRDFSDLGAIGFSTGEQRLISAYGTSQLALKREVLTKAIGSNIEELSQTGSTWLMGHRREVQSIHAYKDYLKNDMATHTFWGTNYAGLPGFKGAQAEIEAAYSGLGSEFKTLETQLLGKGTTPLAKALAEVGPVQKDYRALKYLGIGAAIGLGAYVAYNMFSAKDDNYNSIEGLKHGWFGATRNINTAFGSGFMPGDASDPRSHPWRTTAIAGGAIAGMAYAWNKPVNLFGWKPAISSLNYFDPTIDMISLGRTQAAYKDLLYNTVRRGEYAFGGIFKTPGMSTLMSGSIYKDASYGFSLFDQHATGYTSYLNKITNRNLLTEGFHSVEFRKGKLFGIGDAGETELLKEARLYRRVHDVNVSKSASSLAESFVQTQNVESSIKGNRILRFNTEEFPYLITGSQSKVKTAMQTAHAYAHDTLSKYLRLMDDPGRALATIIPGKLGHEAERLSQYLPKLGVGSEAELVGTVPELLGRHAKRILPWAIGVPLVYSMTNWAVRGIFPKGSALGDAGLTGGAAWGVKTAHLTYARMSDITGLTGVRKWVERQAPGSTGILPTAGFALSGWLTGSAIGVGANLWKEFHATNRYQGLLANIQKTAIAPFPEALAKFPLFKGQMGTVGRYGRYGLVAGLALGLPFLLAGLGSKKSFNELSDEYSGRKEVPIRHSRFWEIGKTPWSGSHIDYFRPNWYARLMSNYKEKSIWGEENVSPIRKAWLSLTDPYYLEKLHYRDRPYPISGSSGESLGIFGPTYEMTLGRILKPPRLMHQEEMAKAGPTHPDLEPSMELGGLPGKPPISPYSAKHLTQQQWYQTYEAMGLRGFASSILKEKVTGSRELFSDETIMQSSADMTSARREFWDLNLGGAGLTSEAARRFMPRRTSDFEYVNPLQNQLPAWLPSGDDYGIDFHQGDAFSKIQEGEYRLPGVGYATRFPELLNTVPEDYPLIHRYKILADVAPYSNQYKGLAAIMSSKAARGELTSYEQEIYNQTQEQLDLKSQRKEFRPDKTSLLGGYYNALADLARANPLEELSPLSPAHKFLGPEDSLKAYEESIYGKEFKLWEHPWEHFGKPTLTSTANILGWNGIPSEIKNRREVEEYFDKLKYLKSQLLEHEATQSGDKEAFARAKALEDTSLIGADPYSNPFKLLKTIPASEKPYFLSFVEAPDAKKEEILRLAPDEMKAVYLAQWDNKILDDLASGNIEGSESEQKELIEQITNRRQQIRLRRRAELDAFASNPDLPPEDWSGWCIPPTQTVLTTNGVKPAQDIQIGDIVDQGITQNKVLDIYTRNVNENLYTIQLANDSYHSMACTGNHEILVARHKPCRYKRVIGSRAGNNPTCHPRQNTKCLTCDFKTFDKVVPTFIPVDKIDPKTDYLVIRRDKFETHNKIIIDLLDYNRDVDTVRFDNDFIWNYFSKSSSKSVLCKRFIEITPELMWLLGYYAAEGSIMYRKGKPRGVSFAQHLNELPYYEKLKDICTTLGLIPKRHERFRDTGNGAQINICSIPFANFISHLVPGKCNTKYLADSQWLRSSRHHAIGFIAGLFNGDSRKNFERASLTTTSYALALLAKETLWSLGIGAGFRMDDRKAIGKYNIYEVDFGYTGNATIFRDLILLGYNPKPQYITTMLPKLYYTNDEFLFLKISSINLDPYVGQVYDFSIENLHEYRSPIGIYHNSPHVDLEDIKLKYVMDQGEDFHQYNLWETRVRMLGRKPYLNQAVQYVKIPERSQLLSATYDSLQKMGLKNVDVQITSGYSDEDSVNIRQDRTKDIRHYLRKGRHIR